MKTEKYGNIDGDKYECSVCFRNKPEMKIVYNSHIPNWWHRFWQRLILGIIWENVEEGEK